MKVLMLTPSYSPIIGGTERVVQQLAINLNQKGVHTDVMTFNMNEKWTPVWREEIKQDCFKVFRLPAFNPFPKTRINPLKILSGAFLIPKLNFTKKLRTYDILHFHDDMDLSFPFFSFFVNRPKIFQCHTLFSSYGIYKKHFFSRAVFRNIADAYTCASGRSKKLLSDLGIPESKIFILSNGVDPEIFKPNKVAKIDNMILHVGRTSREKGVHVLLKALKYLEEPVSLKIAGPKIDNPYINELMRSNGKMKVGIHNVEFLGGVNDTRLMVGLYQQATMLVNPSLTEEFGIVNLEALSCETPVVASNVGGIGVVIKNNVNGLLVPPNDPEKLADAIRKLLKNKDLREKYGGNGRQMVKTHFSWDSITKELIRIYERTGADYEVEV
jgi:glycosyltransferase involved in cell wall biosynthesis